ncbi:unnamed protein product [Caenorhabditis auriculariae]|uniref:Uncharacterized protein n=1 Tax=Caenorhabditis auriculariae TaxID=2777116 RepID=A0A8S1HGJ1_9PELO|nr:unnamed protein product [Caenorhabditis auriculariae]
MQRESEKGLRKREETREHWKATSKTGGWMNAALWGHGKAEPRSGEAQMTTEKTTSLKWAWLEPFRFALCSFDVAKLVTGERIAQWIVFLSHVREVEGSILLDVNFLFCL